MGKPRKRRLKGKKEHVAENGLTHSKIIEYSRKVLKRPGTRWKCGVTFAELSTANAEIPDVLGFYSGGSSLIEAKASRNDFLTDKNKSFRKNPKEGMGCYRFYACPTGVIKENELPENWGLIYVSEKGRCTLVVKPNRQERNLYAETAYMYSILRRIIIYHNLTEIDNFIKKYSDYAERQNNIL
jgi:hypothetical protein